MEASRPTVKAGRPARCLLLAQDVGDGIGTEGAGGETASKLSVCSQRTAIIEICSIVGYMPLLPGVRSPGSAC